MKSGFRGGPNKDPGVERRSCGHNGPYGAATEVRPNSAGRQ
jgi:hypothetical protein